MTISLPDQAQPISLEEQIKEFRRPRESNPPWTLICHPHNDENGGPRPRTGRNRLAKIQLSLVRCIIPQMLLKGPRPTNPQGNQCMFPTHTPTHTTF